MAKRSKKKLITYLAVPAVTAAVCLVLALAWQPFRAENMTTYSAGILGTYVSSHELGETAYALISVAALLLTAVAGYFLGSINYAIITSRQLYNEDIRKFGSKNAGMTNMFRVYGKEAGIFTLLGDTFKTAAAVFLGRLIGGESMAYLAATFCVLGHVAPVQYKFKGGKGVLSSAITILCLDPEIFLILVCVFAAVLLIFRYVSLASVVSAFVYPGLVVFFAQNRFGTPPSPFVLLFAIFVGLFIVFTHRTNLQRISERTENKISFGKKKNKNDDK